MSTTVDERIVSMQFDNKNFERNVQTSMNTLDKLKQSLKLGDASKGLDNINSTAKKFDISHLNNGVETIKAKFSALEVMGVTALVNITDTAINTGKRIASALTIDPVKSGFEEYETQINAVQTILANTQGKGSTLKDVNAALDELNHYADLTIYNFTEMTRNIGTFTAAGVDLDTSVAAIKGIANLAAVSGSTSQQASTAMYQLSQALASGTVKLQDWNSVVNAGMGGQVFQDALKETARAHGVAIDEMIKSEGSFRETLKKGWLTSDVLTETLSKFTGDLSEKQLKTMGYTKEQIASIIKMGKTANDAATKVKTFTQLFDTLKEAAQSGWTQSWEIIVGDFEEAKGLLTEISDVFSGLINSSAESRNNLLQGWKDLGGRSSLVQSAKNAFEGIVSIAKPIKEAFRDIFPPMTAKQLFNITKGLETLTSHLKLSDTQSKNLKSTFKGLFSIIDIGKQAITSILKPILSFVSGGAVSSMGDAILEITASIGKLFIKFDEGLKTGNVFTSMSSVITGALDILSSAISVVTQGVSGMFGSFSGMDKGISGVVHGISNAFKGVFDVVKGIVTWIKDNISAGDVFAGLAGGGIFVAAKKMGSIFDKISGVFDGFLGIADEAKTKIKDILGSLNDSLQSFQQGIKVASIVGIAVAITLLTSSLKTISQIKPEKITYSLVTIGVMMKELNSGFKSLIGALSSFKSKGVVKSAVAMIGMATAIRILASAMVRLKNLSLLQIAKGLVGIGGSLLGLTLAIKHIGNGGVSLRTSAAVIAIAKACQMMSEAFITFSDLSWEKIAHGLVGMGGALGQLTAVTVIINKFGGSVSGAASILILSKSLNEISENLERLGMLTWSEIGRGLVAMGVALGELTAVFAILRKVSGFKSIFTSGAIHIVTESLDEISENLERLGILTWSEIAHGLTAMGGALGEFVIALGVLQKVAGFKSIFSSGAILIVTKSLDEISENLSRLGMLTWSEIGRGLVAMGVALGELAAVSGVLGRLTGLSSILGSGAIVLAVQGLEKISNALQSIGTMSWKEVAVGLVGMGGALTELGLVTGALGKLAGLSGIIGSGAILLGVQGLKKIADALVAFGSMTWDQIAHGLVGMGGALTEIGVISGVLGTLAGPLALVGSGSLLLGVQGLQDLANALKKFGEMNWEEIKSGLAAMGLAMGEVGLGGLLNTLSGFGAKAISTIAAPLGTLAESVKKWSGVSVPEGLATQLSSLASGILSFTLGGLGANALSTAAPGVGQMADAVKKWSGVIVPDTLKDNLTGLADGVKAFGSIFELIGSGVISEVASPLGKLAESVKQWNGVTVPQNIEDDLERLSDAISTFASFKDFFGGKAISNVAGPLGSLGTAVSKWANVKVPENLKDDLTKLSEGIKTFGSSGLNGDKISSISSAVGKLASAVNKVNAVDTSKVSAFVKSVNKLNNINVNTESLSKTASSVGSSVSSMVKTMTSTISKGRSSVNSSMKTAMSGASSAIKSNTSSIVTAVNVLVNAVTKAIKGKKTSVTSAFKGLVSGGASAIKSHRSSFSSAGSYLGAGLVAGINSKKSDVVAAGYNLGKAGAEAVNRGAKVNSPSKITTETGKFIGEGVVVGIAKKISEVVKSGTVLGKTAAKAVNNAVSRISDIIDSGMDATPVISPVVDLSNVNDGVGRMNRLFNASNPLVGVMSNVDAIRSTIGNIQNGSNGDVVSAIKGLRKDIGNISNNSVSIGNVTYDDGSNIIDAVESLIHAANIERRM